MKSKYIILFSLLAMISANALAFEATVSYYIFENKGTNSSGHQKLSNQKDALTIPATWFDWKCSAEKQTDGVLIGCERNGELVETKAFCTHPAKKQARYLRIGRTNNFVSFEISCR